MASATDAHALAADRGFRTQGHVDDAPLTAAHRAEEERHPAFLYFVRCGLSRQPQFFNSQETEVACIKDDQRMVFVRQSQHFHGQMLKSQQKFGFVLQKQFRFRAAELHHDIWIFDFRVGGCTFRKLIVDVDINGVQKDVQEVAYFVFVLFNWIFSRHVFRTGRFLAEIYFFFFTLTTACDGGVTGAGLTLLKTYC